MMMLVIVLLGMILSVLWHIHDEMAKTDAQRAEEAFAREQRERERELRHERSEAWKRKYFWWIAPAMLLWIAWATLRPLI
jgi:hypothetical protein